MMSPLKSLKRMRGEFALFHSSKNDSNEQALPRANVHISRGLSSSVNPGEVARIQQRRVEIQRGNPKKACGKALSGR